MSTGVVSNMPPPARSSGQKRQRDQTLLEEDEWTDRIEAIIQRDFFPDLPKLQNKLEWLQAVRSGDPSQLQQAQLNIAQRRAGIRTPVGATPAGFGTPGASLLRTPGIGLTPTATTPAMTPRLGINAEGRVVSDGPKDPTLDKFFAQHNSEDNSDFKELMKLSQERQRRAKPWLYQDHNPPKDHPLLLTNATAQQQPSAILPVPHSLVMASPAAVPQEVPGTDIQVVVYQAGNAAATKDADRAVQRPAEPTDGYGTTGQESQTLLGWPHTNKSALYYDSSQRDVVPFTEAELADMVQGPPKQIKYSATRFPADFDTTQQPSKAEGSQTGEATHQPGVVRGYGVMNTPAFTPGPEQSPLMTWGDIGSTPIRLDQEDDIHVSTSTGRAFKMASVPARDQLGRGIAQKATLSLKRKAAARAGTPLPAGLPTGRRRGPGTPLPISAAGKRLASNLRGGTPSNDAQLRASYKTLPSGRAGSVQPSPRAGDGFSTPVVGSSHKHPLASSAVLEAVRTRALAAHASGSKAEDTAGPSLTDNLLNL